MLTATIDPDHRRDGREFTPQPAAGEMRDAAGGGMTGFPGGKNFCIHKVIIPRIHGW
jgi:hypothetical protein